MGCGVQCCKAMVWGGDRLTLGKVSVVFMRFQDFQSMHVLPRAIASSSSTTTMWGFSHGAAYSSRICQRSWHIQPNWWLRKSSSRGLRTGPHHCGSYRLHHHFLPPCIGMSFNHPVHFFRAVWGGSLCGVVKAMVSGGGEIQH